FCTETATTEIYTLSLHDALPISADRAPLLAPDLTKHARARVSDVVRSSAPEVAAARGRDLLDRVLAGHRHDPVTHVEQVPPRPGRPADWPDWAPELLVDRF